MDKVESSSMDLLKRPILDYLTNRLFDTIKE